MGGGVVGLGSDVGKIFTGAVRDKLDELGLSTHKAEVKFNLPEGSLRNVINGSIPSLSRGFEICRALGIDLSFEGDKVDIGGMYSELESAQTSPWRQANLKEHSVLDAVHNRPDTSTPDNDLVHVPELDLHFSTGVGSYPEEHPLAVNKRPFGAKWLRDKGLNPANLALARVRGDSMEPLLKDKDMVLLDHSVNTPVHTMPVAFRLESDVYIKLCQPAGDGRLVMISVNKTYDPIYIDREEPPTDFKIIAAVVWHAHSWV